MANPASAVADSSAGNARGIARIRLLLVAVGLALAPAPGHAFESRVLESVVSVLPLWPGHQRGGQSQVPPGAAPEGTATAIRAGGYLVTALHVVARALEITVRLPDGREVPAELVGRDPPTDIALLKLGLDLPLLVPGPEPAFGDRVCALGNPFGLGLSLSCGVVSATRRTGTGFNPIEDFIQTDAAVNPGGSGGALLDAEGRLIGLVSAIFTKQSDANIGVNFAASRALLMRVVEDLAAHGRVIRGTSGLRVADLDDDARIIIAGARVTRATGAAATAGLAAGDIITDISGRAIRRASDVTSALHLHRPGDAIAMTFSRDGERRATTLRLAP